MIGQSAGSGDQPAPRINGASVSARVVKPTPPRTTAEVRLARADDIPGILRLSESYRSEMPDDRPSIDPVRAVEYLRFCVSSELMFLAVVDHDGIKGWLHGFLGSTYLAAPEAHVDMIYVLPVHRRFSTFRRLWRSFEDWARGMGASHLSASEAHGKSLGPLMRRLEMRELGLYYRKAL